jgi:hypothetical protein
VLEFAEFRGILKPGGTVYAGTNGRAHMQEIDDLTQVLAPEIERDGCCRVPWVATCHRLHNPNS